MTEKAEIPPFLLDSYPWEKEMDSIWPGSTLTLRRNLLSYDFPSKLSNLEAEQLLATLKKKIQSVKEIQLPLYLKTPDLNVHGKDFIFEHFLLLEAFPDLLDGEAFIVDSTTKLLLMLNIEDHLQIHLVDSACNLEQHYARLSQIEAAISSTLDFAFNSQFGYLTSDPGLSGTALIANTFLHLPALIHTGGLPLALENHLEESIVPTSLEGTQNGLTGDILILSNLYTLGNTEEGILKALETSTLKMMALEKSLRTQLLNEPSPEMKDHVSRAFGLLTSALQLETQEALNNLSLLKLGLELKWITGTPVRPINELLFKSRQGHLSLTNPTQDLPQTRANYIKSSISNLKLSIVI